MNRFLPLLIFSALFLAFVVGFGLKPREVPSALINKTPPEFSLPPLSGAGIGLSSDDLKDPDHVIIVNFFASWCVPCRVEHPALEKLSKMAGVKLYGINYKDRPAHSLSYLRKAGNPYAKIGADLKGRTAINWGTTGTPETFFIKDGIIRYQHIGPIMDQDMEQKIPDIIKKLQKGPVS